MPTQVFTLLADHVAQPFPDLGVVHRIVVNPALVVGVVGRVNVDAFQLAFELGQQAFERFQVVAVDAAVIKAVGGCAFGRAKAAHLAQHPKRHLVVVVVVDDLVFSDPVQCWHVLF